MVPVLLLIAFGVFVVFSEHWLKGLKTIWEFPGVALLVPLLLGSFLFFASSGYILWCVSWVLVGVRAYLGVLKNHHCALSSMNGMLLTSVVMGLIAVSPTLWAWLTAKPFRPFKPPYWMSIYLCIFLMILVTHLVV